MLNSYLCERKLKVVLDGKESMVHEIHAGVPQGSVLGPLMWNIFLNDLLHLIPEARAFADDGTISITYDPSQENEAIALLNNRLKTIEEWGKKWQVSFAHHKTQLMFITRTPSNPAQVFFNNRQITALNQIDILGVTFDSQLTYKTHIENVARKASSKLAALRRLAWLLDRKGKEILYKAQIRSVMEYSPLTWGGAAKSHLHILNKVQERAQRTIIGGAPQDNNHHTLQDSQHRRDVAGLTTFFKFQEQHVAHLVGLERPLQRRERTTRTVEQTPSAVEVPFARTSHYQRTFIYRYSILWNKLLKHVRYLSENSLQSFKCKINIWLKFVNNENSANTSIY